MLSVCFICGKDVTTFVRSKYDGLTRCIFCEREKDRIERCDHIELRSIEIFDPILNRFEILDL